ncbi:Sodium-coupled monocarboxylate transporter 1 [Chamberlinius hualienensis]
MEYQFQIVDYVIVFILLFMPAAYGLYLSNVKYKQLTLMEYFLGGKTVSEGLIILSYFSTFCAGGISGSAIEAYLFGSQNIAYILVLPVMLFIVYHLVVPVFYPLQNMSILKYFEIRFGKSVTIIALIGSITGMGGMRGIVVTDAIQAIFMIASISILFVIGIIKSGGITTVLDINKHNHRLDLFQVNFDPTIRYTFWSIFVGYGFWVTCLMAINQSLMQRCIMAPTMKSAQRIAILGISSSFLYIISFEVLGIVIFSFYNGCNVLQMGKIETINQLVSYFTMDILYEYSTLPGIIFGGMLCGTMSTISSFLNSVTALIIGQMKMSETQETHKGVVICGLLMFSPIFLLERFQHFSQANVTFMAILSGPAFAIYCIGILFPNSSSKCVATSYLVALLFGFYILVGSLLVKSKDLPKPFTNCTFNAVDNHTTHNFNGSADLTIDNKL